MVIRYYCGVAALMTKNAAPIFRGGFCLLRPLIYESQRSA